MIVDVIYQNCGLLALYFLGGALLGASIFVLGGAFFLYWCKKYRWDNNKDVSREFQLTFVFGGALITWLSQLSFYISSFLAILYLVKMATGG